jgi:hypothetical protein
MEGDPHEVEGDVCRSDGYTPDMQVRLVCEGVTEDVCCDLNGDMWGESACSVDLDSVGDYATQLAACQAAGGSEQENSQSTCSDAYDNVAAFPGEAWCQRRACENCGHSWADALRGAARCCGGQGTVCDTAGASESICADPDDFMPTLAVANFCDNVDAAACCGLSGSFQEHVHHCVTLDEEMGSCRMESRGSNSTASQQDACATAGGTFRPSRDDTCARRMQHARGWGGAATCTDPASQSAGTRSPMSSGK